MIQSYKVPTNCRYADYNDRLNKLSQNSYDRLLELVKLGAVTGEEFEEFAGLGAITAI